MPAVRASLFALLLTSLVGLEALALAGVGPAPDVSVLSVYALFGASSLAVLYVLQTARAKTRPFVIGVLAGAAVGAAWLLWRDATARTAARGGLALAAVVGLGGYLADAAAAPDAAGRRACLRALRDATLVPLAVMQVPFFLWATTGINPVYDARVLAVEASLGVELSVVAHDLFAALPGLSHVALACYFALPVGLAVAVHQQPTDALRQRVLLAALAGGGIGFVLYAVSPVVGMFPAFPMGVPPAASIAAAPMVVTAEVPRNGMPSLHTAWALLIALNAWRLPPRWRFGLAAFAALNVYAAAGAVGHWVLDIVVAVPMAVAVQLALVTAGHPGSRVAGVVACAALTLAWVVGLRLGLTPAGSASALTWLLVAVTVAVPLAWLARVSGSGRR